MRKQNSGWAGSPYIPEHRKPHLEGPGAVEGLWAYDFLVQHCESWQESYRPRALELAYKLVRAYIIHPYRHQFFLHLTRRIPSKWKRMPLLELKARKNTIENNVLASVLFQSFMDVAGYIPDDFAEPLAREVAKFHRRNLGL